MYRTLVDDDVFTHVKGVRALRGKGRYSDAVIELGKLIEEFGPKINLVLELSDTLFVQGYFVKVIQSLNRHTFTEQALDCPAYAAIQLIRIFSQFLATAHFRALLAEAESVYAKFASGECGALVDDAVVRVETYYCKFRHLATRCGLLHDVEIKEKLLVRLRTIFHILIQRDDFFNALSVARTYSVCCEGPEGTSLIAELITSEQAPSCYQAHACFILGKSLTAIEQRPKQTEYYTRARQYFQEDNHVHGVLDTNIAMTCRFPFDPTANEADGDIVEMVESYKSLDYPTGYADVLLVLLNTFYELHDFRYESLIMDELEALYPASTSKLCWVMFQVSTLARRAITGASQGKIIHGGEALWEALKDSDCKFFRGQAALLVSQAYSALKDRDNMALWSQRAQKDLTDTDLTAIPALVKNYDMSTHEGLLSCHRMIMAFVDETSPGRTPEIMVEKLDVFLSQALVHAHRDQQSLDVIEGTFGIYEATLSKVADSKQKLLHLAKLRESQAALLMMRASSRQDIELELAALPAAKESRDIYLKAKELGRAIIALQREALLNLGIAQKFEKTHDLQERLAWETATNQYRVAFESAADLSLTFLARDCSYWVAYCQYRQWIKGWCSPGTLLISLHKAEAFVDQQRQELSILHRMAAVVAKRRLSSDEHTRNIYRIAVQVCSATKDLSDAWNWVQRSKARSLSDMLGLGVFIPHKLMTKIREDADCLALFQSEQSLADQLSAAPDTERFKYAAHLENHQSLMRKETILAELLDLRAGAPIMIDDFSAQSAGLDALGKTTLFVDWVFTETSLVLFVAKQGETPVMKELAIRIDEVRNWKSQYLDGLNGPALAGMLEDDEPDEGPLRAMDTLIAPLVELSSPEDLLVLCPSDVLHALPLHALRLGLGDQREMLIERNPVVYCASLTSFVQCCSRAVSITNPAGEVKNQVLAVYETDSQTDYNSFTQFNKHEHDEIYESAKQLALAINGNALCGNKVSVQSFKDSFERADIVHFVGHCDYSGELVSEQSLRLSSEEQDEYGKPRPTSISVKDLFDLNIKTSHVSLLACASAMQNFANGDEPLGLVTAFLSAGATSVLGTIWPVRVSAAIFFSEKFYHHLASSWQNDPGLYNLAYATREAILDLKQRWNFRHPYYWAPFVLHGSWFLRGALGIAKS